jgi:predicted alpha/beta superfamily hydrolase
MKEIKRFQVRGIPGAVTRADFSGRIVDFWAPEGGSDHVLIAHDGQNIFDRKTATFIYTWRLAQTAIRVARDSGKHAPLIIGVFHSSTKDNPHGRSKDLCPEDPFREGVKPASSPLLSLDQLGGNDYLEKIFGEITPEIALQTHSHYLPTKTAMIGSSMGGLATLYAAIKHADKFRTALALSPHWPLAENALVDWMIPKIPRNNDFKVWMSRGTKGLDSSYKPFQDRADQLMLNLNWSANNFKSKVFHRTTHNERSWASYVDEPLKFWLG